MKAGWTLTGRKALITGATKGIGRAIAEEFMELGAEVTVVARNAIATSDIVKSWNEKGYRVTGICADVSLDEDRARLFGELEKKWPQFDILVNNVGTNIRKKPLIIYRMNTTGSWIPICGRSLIFADYLIHS